jgi:uncharacterized protein
MTTELRPSGVRCNLACRYCYQQQMRGAGNITGARDTERMLRVARQVGGRFTLFGGEALLTPIAELERIFQQGLEQAGENGIQTNGALVTEEHLRLFRRYKVHVGISLDGPDELNDARWAGSVEKTREATARSQAVLDHLLGERHPSSLIVTLHRGNATDQHRPRLKAWLRELGEKGLQSVRLHVMEVESEEVREGWALSMVELLKAMGDMARFWMKVRKPRIDIFADIAALLSGKDGSTTCVWNACDPYTTEAVVDIDERGNIGNCGHVSKDGVAWLKGQRAGYERQMSLSLTPQEEGGCKGCRFFIVCKGHCPGTAIEGDWRLRTEHCELWRALMGAIEGLMIASGEKPVTLPPHRAGIERVMLDGWKKGQRLTIEQAIARLHGHSVEGNTGHVDTPHVNTEHVDWWGHPDVGK